MNRCFTDSYRVSAATQPSDGTNRLGERRNKGPNLSIRKNPAFSEGLGLCEKIHKFNLQGIYSVIRFLPTKQYPLRKPGILCKKPRNLVTIRRLKGMLSSRSGPRPSIGSEKTWMQG